MRKTLAALSIALALTITGPAAAATGGALGKKAGKHAHHPGAAIGAKIGKQAHK